MTQPVGSAHRWAVVVLQSKMSSARPTVLTLPGMSRQWPDFTLTSVGVAPLDHCWPAAPVDGATMTGVYRAVAPPSVRRTPEAEHLAVVAGDEDAPHQQRSPRGSAPRPVRRRRCHRS